MKQRTWKQIEDSRDRRLWVTNVAIPVATLATSVYAASPEVRDAVNKKVRQVKWFVRTKKTEIQNKIKNHKEESN